MNAIHIYRVANYLYRMHVPLLPGLLRFLMFLLYNSVIPPQCRIGKGSSFAHGGIGIVLHPDCCIGERVLIGEDVSERLDVTSRRNLAHVRRGRGHGERAGARGAP